QPAKDPLGLTDAIHSSPQVFPERLPVVLVPTTGEMLAQPFGKSGVIEENRRLRTLLLQPEPRDRIDTRLPIHHSPRLHDSLARHELQMSAEDVATKDGERPADAASDLRRRRIRHAAERQPCRELPCIRQRRATA